MIKVYTLILFLSLPIFSQDAGQTDTTPPPEDPIIESFREEIKVLKEASLAIKQESEVFRSEVNLLWVCIASFLVFFMQAGFALVEAGFTRAKNAVNILMKNLSDFTLGSICFWLIGFSLMFGPHIIEGVGLGKISFLETGLLLDESGKPSSFKFGFFLFQLVFAATATTIVSGAMAERTKFSSNTIFWSYMLSVLIFKISSFSCLYLNFFPLRPPNWSA